MEASTGRSSRQIRRVGTVQRFPQVALASRISETYTRKMTSLSALPPFEEFASISRLSRDMVVTEKLDGTNAQVMVLDDGRVVAGSRNRFITPTDDNFGFARWVAEHEDELRVGLGIGSHYGEWWGSGIQRRYGLDHKRFSLFNVARWGDDAVRPKCCHVVPVLLRWTFDTHKVDEVLAQLSASGSVAAAGFMNPEGVVVYHAASRTLFKKTLDKNDGHKGSV